MLADGYLGRPDLDAEAFVQVDGVRHLRTTDLGAWSDDTLTVLGRADDVLVTGGTKVPPGPVESVLAAAARGRRGVRRRRPRPGVGSGRRRRARRPPRLVATPARRPCARTVADRLGAAHAPRHVVVTDSLPMRGPGKIDRRAATQLAARSLERNLT